MEGRPRPASQALAERERMLDEMAENYPDECQWPGCDTEIEMGHPEDPPLCDEHDEDRMEKMLEMHES